MLRGKSFLPTAAFADDGRSHHIPWFQRHDKLLALAVNKLGSQGTDFFRNQLS
jgi:hypothetical protein